MGVGVGVGELEVDWKRRSDDDDDDDHPLPRDANEKRLSSRGYAGRPDVHLRDALRGPRRDIFSQDRRGLRVSHRFSAPAKRRKLCSLSDGIAAAYEREMK